MSCQIKEVASIVNLQDVKQQLLAGVHYKSTNYHKEDVLFQDSLISLSPTGEILAIGWNSRIVVLESKWDSQEPGQVKNKLTPSWSKEVASNYNERITAIACIPLILLGKSGAGVSTDWTCIAIGFTTGFIKFYTDDGTFLLETQLHHESIIGIKCQSFSASKYSEDTTQVEELHVIYSSVVCVLQGFSLCTTLRSYRTHLAKVQANCTQQPPDINLVCKKWGFRNQDLMNDCQVIGTTSVNTFDHLTTTSICGGFSASYRSSAPQHTLVTATGKRPFVGFHYVLEGGSAPVLTDVAIAMASKVANAIGSAVPWFLRGNKSLTIPEKNKGLLTEPAESMACRFGLSDLTREGYTIVPSPNKILSAISDGVGRVILVDNIQGVAVRMFKGYRDAQCGWVEVVEEKHRSFDSGDGRSRDTKSRLRRALFLVIYAPKKGVIDIWLAQHGSKIATFSAGKNGRLLYLNYGLFGLNDTVTPSRPNRAHYPCVFIDSLGGIKEIIVPFHFALDSQNSQKSRDLHLFRKLKIFLREEMYDNEKLINEIKNTCTELRTNEVKLQILEMLMSNKNIVPDALTCAAACLHNAELDLSNEKLEPVQKSVHLLSAQLLQVIEFYKYVRSNFDDNPNFNTEKPIHFILQTSEREAHRMLKLSKTVKELENLNIKGQNRVKFEEDERAFLNFISCFEFNEKDMITVRKGISLYDKCILVELIYDGQMYSYETISAWQRAAKQSRIQPLTFMELLLFYWLNRKFTDCLELEVIRCLEMVCTVCSLSSIEEVCAAENNQTSQWWDNVREVLSNSTNPFHALIVAMACRVVALSLERNKELCANITGDNDSANGDDDDKLTRTPSVDQAPNSETRNTTVSSSVSAQSSISDWENVSTETCQFSLLIGNLEDITTLSAIVSKKPQLDASTTFLTLEYEKINVSLETIINRGKGSISEIVAKWLSSSGVEPIKLIDTTDIEFDRLHLIQELLKNEAHLESTDVPELSAQSSTLPIIETGSEAKDEEETCLLQTIKKVSLLKLHFPYSLTSSVLLANLCWEYVMLWNEDKTRLDAFDAAVTVLRHIPMKHMRHGVCSLLWTLHIKQRMEAIAELMNEHGQLPKKGYFVNFSTIGLTVNQIVSFLQTCVNFLDIFLDAEILESDKCIEIRFEELWETQVAGPEPLATLAVSQAPAWYDSVMLHSMLANVLYMMAHFNLTVFKPLNNLFDSMEQRSLFQDISDKPMFVVQQDPQLDSCRMEFLRRVITSSMESIQQDTTEASNFNFQQAFSWMCKCQTMASIWKINTDELRIHQVCQLYQDGFDRLADEVIISVNDTTKLSENLLPIAGGRLRSHLSKVYGQTFLNDVSRISPTLRTYLLGLDYVESNRVFTNCTNYDTIELARKVATTLPETSNNYHLAQLILDATLILTDDT